jgi:L-ascorbate metabolism protein UlaG (beta-lactamase superfamily)
MTDVEGIEVRHLGHDSFILSAGGKTVCTDPYKISSSDVKADIILITHDHFDHCDPPSVSKLSGPDTVVIAPFGCSVKLKANFREISQGGSVTEKGVKVEAVAAYNIGKPYHPRGIGVGYVITLGGKRIYHAGDTDRIPEMKKLRDIDIALLPVSGTYVMNAKEAAAASNDDIGPKTAIPMHYGSVVGSVKDAEDFRAACRCRVVVL